MKKKPIIIEAEVHSDDHVYEVTFNALTWFKEASEQEVVNLARIGWGGNYEADAVAQYLEDENREIEVLMDYCRKPNACGFECHVDEEQAVAWLKVNRPEILKKIVSD